MCVCIFVRAVSGVAVGMLKGCDQHLEADTSRRWGERADGRWVGLRYDSNQMRTDSPDIKLFVLYFVHRTGL